MNHGGLEWAHDCEPGQLALFVWSYASGHRPAWVARLMPYHVANVYGWSLVSVESNQTWPDHYKPEGVP